MQKTPIHEGNQTQPDLTIVSGGNRNGDTDNKGETNKSSQAKAIDPDFDFPQNPAFQTQSGGGDKPNSQPIEKSKFKGLQINDTAVGSRNISDGDSMNESIGGSNGDF